MAGSLLLLLDDIATVLDDDLALNAKEVTAFLCYGGAETILHEIAGIVADFAGRPAECH